MERESENIIGLAILGTAGPTAGPIEGMIYTKVPILYHLFGLPYLQPLLQTKFSTLNASFIVGLLWGLWHIGNFQFGLLFMALFLVSALSISASFLIISVIVYRYDRKFLR